MPERRLLAAVLLLAAGCARPRSTVALELLATDRDTITLALAGYAQPGPTPPVAVQLRLELPASSAIIRKLDVARSAQLSDTHKQIVCQSGAHEARCVVFGGRSALPSGEWAQVHLLMATPPLGAIPIQVSGVIASSREARVLPGWSGRGVVVPELPRAHPAAGVTGEADRAGL